MCRINLIQDCDKFGLSDVTPEISLEMKPSYKAIFFRNRSLRLQKDPKSSQTKLCWHASKRHKSQEIQMHGLDSGMEQVQVRVVRKQTCSSLLQASAFPLFPEIVPQFTCSNCQTQQDFMTRLDL
jgi:hypothetical protein